MGQQARRGRHANCFPVPDPDPLHNCFLQVLNDRGSARERASPQADARDVGMERQAILLFSAGCAALLSSSQVCRCSIGP
jgi:hypothetical protein